MCPVLHLVVNRPGRDLRLDETFLDPIVGPLCAQNACLVQQGDDLSFHIWSSSHWPASVGLGIVSATATGSYVKVVHNAYNASAGQRVSSTPAEICVPMRCLTIATGLVLHGIGSGELGPRVRGN
jgi:hypothetical protein